MTTAITEPSDLRLALGDDLRWRILTSDDEGRDAAISWLRDSLAGVRSDRKGRKARSIVQQSAAAPHTRAWHQVRAEFAEWESRSRGFERLVLRRLRELGMNEQGHPVGPPSTVLDRARRHAEYCQEQMRHAVNS